MKAVKTALQEKGASADEVTAFEKGAQTYVKEKLLPNFKDFEFFTGESMNPDGMYVENLPHLNLVRLAFDFVANSPSQHCSSQLPRGRRDSLYRCLEARSH